jgi:hypothetical protein
VTIVFITYDAINDSIFSAHVNILFPSVWLGWGIDNRRCPGRNEYKLVDHHGD